MDGISTTLNTSNARDKVLADHQRLRILMLDVVHATKRAVHDEKAMFDAREALVTLATALDHHLDFEEEVIVPILSRSGDRGASHANSLLDEHGSQRAALTAMVEDARLGTRPTADLIDEIGWFVRGLERDMELEEKGLLSDPIFADDATDPQLRKG